MRNVQKCNSSSDPFAGSQNQSRMHIKEVKEREDMMKLCTRGYGYVAYTNYCTYVQNMRVRVRRANDISSERARVFVCVEKKKYQMI